MDLRCVPNNSIVLAVALENPCVLYIYLAKNGCIVVFPTKWSKENPSGHCLYNTYY